MQSFSNSIKLILILLAFSLSVKAQTFDKANIEDCEFKLSKARALFEIGQLDKIPQLLEPCAINKTLSKSVRISVLKLLTESYLFMNKMDQANKSYRGILAIDPFYQPRHNIDHPELIFLSKEYTTIPTFSFGIKTGGNTTFVQSTNNYIFEDTVKTISESYKNSITYHAGFFLSYHIPKSKLELMAELLYANISYDYSGNIDTEVEGETANLIFDETYTTLSFPISLKLNIGAYKPGKKSMSFYTYIGGAYDLLLSGRIENITLTVQKYNTINRPGGVSGIDLINTTQPPIRKKNNFSIHGGFGMKYHIKSSHLFFDLRYSNTLQNIVKTENRYSNENLLNFWHVDNDLKWHTLYLSIGYGYSFFSVRNK